MKFFFQPFLERRGDWTYCALAIRHLSQEDAGNYTVSVRNKYGEKSNHVRLSMKDQNEPAKYANSNQLLYYLYMLVYFFSTTCFRPGFRSGETFLATGIVVASAKASVVPTFLFTIMQPLAIMQQGNLTQDMLTLVACRQKIQTTTF